MSDKRQKNQLLLAFAEENRREAPNGLGEGTEWFAGKRGTESPAIGEQRIRKSVLMLREHGFRPGSVRGAVSDRNEKRRVAVGTAVVALVRLSGRSS